MMATTDKNSFIRSNLTGAIIVIGLSVIYLSFFYNKNIFNPNSYLFTDGGDGLKSFYVYNFHIKNDTSFTYTNSVNYPYGEIHVFTDGQTLFANLFKCLKYLVPSIGNYSIAFLNLLMLFSYSFCFLFLFYILRKFGTSTIFSILGSCTIGLLSPQVFRFLGHPSLSYCFLIPLTWYLQILFFEQKKWINTIYIMLLLLVAPFIHSYYILICGFFVFFNWIVNLIIRRNWLFLRETLPHILIQVFVPIFFFQAYVKIIDTHVGRSTEPFGILKYVADFNTVFIPHQGPFKFIFENILNIKEQEWEGWSYIGTSTILILLLALFTKLILVVTKKKSNIDLEVPLNLQTALIASVLLLFYSFGYPFKWNMMFLFNYVPPLKQFRGLGRFSWVFYYVISIYSVYFLYKLYTYVSTTKFKFLAVISAVFLFAISFAEGIDYHNSISQKTNKATNQFLETKLYSTYKDAYSSIDKNKYQAIIPLPYFHIGSEAQTREAPDSTMKSAMYFAFHTNLPLVASSSARCSMLESKKLIQLFAPTFLEKEVMYDFKSKKPFLIIYCNDKLKDDEQIILNKSHEIYANKNLKLFELTFDELFEKTADKELSKFDSIKPNLVQYGEFLLSKNSKQIYYDEYEKFKTDTAFNSKGSKFGKIKDYTILLEPNKFEADENQNYLASFWIYNNGTFVNSGMAVTEERSFDGNWSNWTNIYNLSECQNIIGDWSLVEMKFKINKKGNSISLFTLGDAVQEKITYRDNLLIRPTDVDVYKIVESKNGKTTKLFKNNFIIKKEE